MVKRSQQAIRLFFVFRAICLVLGMSLALSADPAADEVIKKVQDHYNSARTLSVTFSEKYSILGHIRPEEAGTLTLRKQGKMRWDYTRPQGKLFLSDGKNVYLYTAMDNRVEKVPLKDTEDMRAPLAFLLGRLDLKREFRDIDLSGSGPGPGTWWLDAKAKNDRIPYESIRMLIAPDGSIRQLKVIGRDDSVIEYSFADEKLNPPVGDEAFRFTIPPGATVVESIEFGSQGK